MSHVSGILGIVGVSRGGDLGVSRTYRIVAESGSWVILEDSRILLTRGILLPQFGIMKKPYKQLIHAVRCNHCKSIYYGNSPEDYGTCAEHAGLRNDSRTRLSDRERRKSVQKID